jgi:hypothetical protein
VTALAAEFPAWEIALRPAGLDIVTALWRSPDGRSMRYIVAMTETTLRNRLLLHAERDGAQGMPPPLSAR